jgi:DHA2 family multidrug resistance protein
MALIDGTVVNVGLDTIAGNLGASIDEASWVGSIYVLAALFVMPLTGWFAANLGRKRAFLYALVTFTVASILCAISGSLPELTIARFLQGLGGGLMLPLALAALVDTYPSDQLASAFKLYGAAVMIGPAVGPAVAGWVLTHFTWPLIFLINVPLGVASLFLCSAYLRDQSVPGEKSAFDWTSLFLMILGFTSLQYVIQEGPRRDWFDDQTIVAASIAGVTAIALFIRVQLRAEIPFVDLRPLAIPSYTIGMILALLTGICFTGTALMVPLYMQDVLQYAPDMAGYIMVPSALGGVLGSEISGRIGKHVSPSLVAGASLVLCAIGTFWFAFLGDRGGFGQAIVPRFVQGIGLGLLWIPLNVLVVKHVPKGLVDAASGLSALVRQLGAGFGFAILGTLVVRTKIAATTIAASRLRQATIPTDTGLSAIHTWFVGHGWSSSYADAYSLSVLQQLIVHEATSVAYSQMFMLVGWLFVLSLPFLVLFHLVPGKETDPA